MSKKLFKNLVVLLSAVFTFIFSVLIKVKVTTIVGEEKSEAVKYSFFDFLDKAKEGDTLGFTRVFMWIGFVLLLVVLVYQVMVFILSLFKQDTIVSKLSLINKIASFVLVGAVVILLVAGLGYSSDTISIPLVGEVTHKVHTTLFGVSWTLALIFSLVPFASEYLINE